MNPLAERLRNLATQLNQIADEIERRGRPRAQISAAGPGQPLPGARPEAGDDRAFPPPPDLERHRAELNEIVKESVERQFTDEAVFPEWARGPASDDSTLEPTGRQCSTCATELVHRKTPLAPGRVLNEIYCPACASEAERAADPDDYGSLA